MNIVPIVFACDSNYLPLTYVAIYSILKHRKKLCYLKFYILIPAGTDRKYYDKNWKYNDYEIRYIEISGNYFADLEIKGSHITFPTYYRLLIPDVLKEYDKCIYLDVDTLVCGDIYELFILNTENAYLAAGLGIDTFFTEEREKSLAGYLQIPSARNYFNAGVLVMNLKKMRSEKVVCRFLECSKKRWICQDQDVLNICCYGKTKIFSLRYNVYSLGFGYRKEMLETRFSASEIEEGLTNPCIIHYATKETKPWFNLNAIKSDDWWKVARESMPAEIYEEIYLRAEKETKSHKVSDLGPKLYLYRKAIIFGSGKAGKGLLDILEKIYKGKITGFWDNNPLLAGTEYKNKKICLPGEKENNDTLIIISCQYAVDEIRKQLRKLGFQDKEISVYEPGCLDSWYGLEKKYKREILEKYKSEDMGEYT